MGEIAFIVWRESVEALLVVGILYAWLRTEPAGRRDLIETASELDEVVSDLREIHVSHALCPQALGLPR